MRVDPNADRFLETIDGQATEKGAWTRSNLAPGSYLLELRSADEARWVHERIEVVRGMEPLFVDVPLISVTGTLRRGDEPAPGELWFGTRQGARRILFRVDQEGEFRGSLPSAGDWALEWLPEDGGGQVGLKPVKVPQRRRVELDLEVPDTRLVGQVVDQLGQPVTGAEVSIFSLDGVVRPSSSKSGEDGRFSLLGLEPGSFGVSAQVGDASSDMVPVSLAEGKAPPELRLVLRGKQRVAGWVHSEGRGVPGATITAWPDLGSAPGLAFERAVSGPDGWFEVQLPGSAQAMSLLVDAPGYARTLRRVPLETGDAVVLEMDRYGGTLDLSTGVGKGPSAFVVHDGAFLPVQVLAQLLRAPEGGAEGSVSLPNLAAGPYVLCAGTGVLGALRSAHEPPAQECSSGILPPLGALQLELGPAAEAPPKPFSPR